MKIAYMDDIPAPLLKRLSLQDWLYALLLLVGAVFAFQQYGSFMDGYEVGFLFGAVALFSWLGWQWKPMRPLLLAITLISLFSIYLYNGEQASVNQVFLLKYLISSQSAVMWMNVLFVLAMLTYWLALFSRSIFAGKVASSLVWSAVVMGFVGLMVRWYESYLIAPDVGHIPISNLYEVFILFCLITALAYLYYEGRYATKQLGGFVLLVINAAVGFILWYTFDRQAYEIQPLVPALQSYWMKIHVPANFIGYGTFSLAAMVGAAYLLADRGILASRLPSLEILDDLMYKAISVGFAFFTIATILGAMWAAEAWGGYWSWDPKETWALIVWLNYAAWLHLRLVKGLRGPILAWWALVGLIVTTFAFLGVNMFLSGLHSYGEL
ncbi:c-type cytochrome biogenesis protein CcsB [Methylobacillus gramineus]|uniref:c-type cytochrome biogenesis protein CcsB n=1 Tax=Methylobacillus gramineus TaxID=755169 RepID=UPI001CFFC3C4|nr:c-type cytochrome biogenesis protein CcsB [Methylobacillus gramineus]MCB5185617.1 c-type cytochrome biogenesis protein CcsB [Methylobacillus gramineus]